MNENLEPLEVQDSSNKLDEYFINIAFVSATRSKDKRTKVGVCLAKNKRLLSIGYNGAPRNFPDNEVPDSSDSSLPLKECKYSYMCHAEPNAILNYGGSIRDLDGSTLYCTISPCHECAKLIIQAGVKEVVYEEEYHNKETWEMAKLLFDKCGVKYRKLKQ